jgi:arylsulfatase A-like enzyme
VVLVMVDTLRADHLSCYGGPVDTPNLCSLAEDGGTRFRGYSHSSWTKPATATLLTSLLPSSHGVMSKPSSLSPDVEMIPEVLRGNGYATGGIVSNINLASSFGFEQGYDEYHYLGPDYLFGARESSSKLILYQLLRRIFFKLVPGLRVGDFYQSGETVNQVAFDFLERHADSRFFLFLHYMDPHDPYFAHPYDGTGIARAGNQNPDPSLAEEMQRLYKGEIAYLDARFGEFLAKLRELGLEDDTLIALVSDHGEEFYEHGGWWHGTTLYEEQIAVPFLVKWSRHGGLPEGVGDGAVARMLDVAPTLIARTGARTPEAMQGIDLVERLSRRTERERLIFAEEDHEGNVLRAVRSGDWKWIEANPGNHRGLPEEVLFHLGKDPGESENVAGSTSWVVQELRDHADAQERLAESRAVEGGGEADLSAQEIETLKALGYLEE